MILHVNDFPLNTGERRAYLNDEITGLELPEIRGSIDEFSEQDGGYSGPQNFGPRRVSLTGTIFASDVTELEDTRRDLQVALTSNPTEEGYKVELRILTNAGRSYVLNCVLYGRPNLPIKRELFKAPFKFDLVAPDPIIYDTTAGSELSAPLSKLVSGGYTFPVTYPYTYAASSLPTTVNNSGTVAVRPLIQLTGVMNRPRVLNRASGHLVQLDNLVTGPGDVVEIDMSTSAIRLNGTSIYYKRSANTTFWSLALGENPIELTTIGSDDTVTGLIKWRPGIWGF